MSEGRGRKKQIGHHEGERRGKDKIPEKQALNILGDLHTERA